MCTPLLKWKQLIFSRFRMLDFNVCVACINTLIAWILRSTWKIYKRGKPKLENSACARPGLVPVRYYW